MIGYAFEFRENEGMFCEEEQLCDFNIEVTGKETIKTLSTGLEENRYLIKVTYTDGRAAVSKWLKDPRSIDYFRLFEVNDSLLSSKAKTLIANKLLDEITRLPQKITIIVSSGLNNIDGHFVYAMGGEILHPKETPAEMGNISLKAHQPKIPAQQLNAGQLLERAKKYILLLPGVTEILFFFSLFAVVKPFVEQLQIRCGFLLALIAPSGQFKTTLARLYCLWLMPEGSQEIPIYSGMRTQHILDFIDTMSGQNILVDDLRKGRDANERKRQETRLDMLSRHTDSNFGCANIILTGETMDDMGIFSCIDRILQLQMPIMDAGQIQKLQKDMAAIGKNLMPEIALAFAKKLMENYNGVLKDIRDFYDENILNGSQTGIYATRTYRHAMFIRLTEFLFRKYFHPMVQYNNANWLDAALDIQIKKQDEKLAEIRFSESSHNYIMDFYTIINSGKYVQACTSRNEYSCSDTAILMSNDKIYITSTVLKDCFYLYYGRYIPPKVIVGQFHSEGILEEEPNSKGFQKNMDGKKHYVINMKILIHYLVRQGHPVSDDMKKRYLPSGQPN